MRLRFHHANLLTSAYIFNYSLTRLLIYVNACSLTILLTYFEVSDNDLPDVIGSAKLHLPPWCQLSGSEGARIVPVEGACVSINREVGVIQSSGPAVSSTSKCHILQRCGH